MHHQTPDRVISHIQIRQHLLMLLKMRRFKIRRLPMMKLKMRKLKMIDLKMRKLKMRTLKMRNLKLRMFWIMLRNQSKHINQLRELTTIQGLNKKVLNQPRNRGCADCINP